MLTTEGQGRAADPVGFGIPVVIDGPWAEPRIYPDMAGILDNPDAAYAKLKEMGKGLFGPRRIGRPAARSGGGLSDMLGGTLGETLGNLLQQGLGQGSNQANQGPIRVRSGPEPEPRPAGGACARRPARAAQNDPPPQPQQDSQPMNDVLRQLFNR